MTELHIELIISYLIRILKTQEQIQGELKKMGTQTNALDAQIANLTEDVSAETTVEQSAITLINGIPALISAAVSQAQAAGATPAELAALTALGTSITNSSTQLAAAVTANTPTPPTPAPTN